MPDDFDRDPASLGARYIIAILRNAHDLASDALVLLEAERYARAFALATFAIEEAGKASLTDERLTFREENPFRTDRHETKLTAARQMLALWESLGRGVINTDEWFSEAHGFDADHDFYSRMAGLYVDADPKLGEVVGGGADITAERAAELVSLAGYAAHVAMQLMWVRNGGAAQESPSPEGAPEAPTEA